MERDGARTIRGMVTKAAASLDGFLLSRLIQLAKKEAVICEYQPHPGVRPVMDFGSNSREPAGASGAAQSVPQHSNPPQSAVLSQSRRHARRAGSCDPALSGTPVRYDCLQNQGDAPPGPPFPSDRAF